MASLDDYTRVVLDAPGGDYINASYIKVKICAYAVHMCIYVCSVVYMCV